MVKLTWSKHPPKTEGFYLVERGAHATRPELVKIVQQNGKLWYIGHISVFPLENIKLEPRVRYSERLEL